jgi:hypothetical protein
VKCLDVTVKVKRQGAEEEFEGVKSLYLKVKVKRQGVEEEFRIMLNKRIAHVAEP